MELYGDHETSQLFFEIELNFQSNDKLDSECYPDLCFSKCLQYKELLHMQQPETE